MSLLCTNYEQRKASSLLVGYNSVICSVLYTETKNRLITKILTKQVKTNNKVFCIPRHVPVDKLTNSVANFEEGEEFVSCIHTKLLYSYHRRIKPSTIMLS